MIYAVLALAGLFAGTFIFIFRLGKKSEALRHANARAFADKKQDEHNKKIDNQAAGNLRAIDARMRGQAGL